MPNTLPQTFGRYHVIKKLGQGGMGAVYLAEDTVMRRKVALKVPNFDGKETQGVLDRFYREARVAAEIRHPGVCPVHDVGEINGIHFLTMAYIEGTPLDTELRGGQPWPASRTIDLVVRIADALQALHQRGIVHRDLKPGNIVLQADGAPVLLDFGLARSLVASSQFLTSEGASQGTPAYMAPEQIAGKAEAIGPQTDVYALGVILFQLLTGRLPFRPVTLAELFGQVLYAERPRPSEFAAVCATLDQLCLDTMAIDPAHRPADMGQLKDRLLQCQDTLATRFGSEVKAVCPNCGKRVRITERMAGKKIVCPGCKGRIGQPSGRETVTSPPPGPPPVSRSGVPTADAAIFLTRTRIQVRNEEGEPIEPGGRTAEHPGAITRNDESRAAEARENVVRELVTWTTLRGTKPSPVYIVLVLLGSFILTLFGVSLISDSASALGSQIVGGVLVAGSLGSVVLGAYFIYRHQQNKLKLEAETAEQVAEVIATVSNTLFGAALQVRPSEVGQLEEAGWRLVRDLDQRFCRPVAAARLRWKQGPNQFTRLPEGARMEVKIDGLLVGDTPIDGELQLPELPVGTHCLQFRLTGVIAPFQSRPFVIHQPGSYRVECTLPPGTVEVVEVWK